MFEIFLILAAQSDGKSKSFLIFVPFLITNQC